jgi:hypothetical protein
MSADLKGTAMQPKYHLWIPALFVAIHTAAVIAIQVIVASSDDGETGMLWGLCIIFDFPVSILFGGGPGYPEHFFFEWLVFGGLQWFAVGMLVAAIWHVCEQRTWI